MTEAEGEAWRNSRHKLPEGYRMTLWPSFRALMKRLGVDLPNIRVPGKHVTPEYDFYREKVKIEFLAGKNVVVGIAGKTVVTDHGCFEAFQYPEAQTYFRVLGIPVEQWVIDLTIEFAAGEFPTYTMRAALSVPGHEDPEGGS